eukprot:3146645-Rhodomonas_salina.2
MANRAAQSTEHRAQSTEHRAAQEPGADIPRVRHFTFRGLLGGSAGCVTWQPLTLRPAATRTRARAQAQAGVAVSASLQLSLCLRVLPCHSPSI